MFVSLYVCMYVYIDIHTPQFDHVILLMYVCMYICMHVYQHEYSHVRIISHHPPDVCMYVCIDVLIASSITPSS